MVPCVGGLAGHGSHSVCKLTVTPSSSAFAHGALRTRREGTCAGEVGQGSSVESTTPAFLRCASLQIQIQIVVVIY